MRLFMTVLFFLMMPVCRADQPDDYLAEKAAMDIISVRGVVVSFRLPDQGKGVRAELVFKSAKGELWTYLLASGASVKGKDGKDISLSDIKAGLQASIDYVIYRRSGRTSRVYEVQAINLL
ncbi:MAG: hypothetical protein V2A70_04735 [Candidatus Omnitrophota bacterium]